MTEIKFRGICKKSGEFVYGDLIHGVGPKNGNIYILPSKTNLAYVKHCDPLDGVQVNPESVGQFTGLLDKNGKEIYEGDIVKNWQGGWNVVVWKSPTFEATVSAEHSCMYSIEWWQQVEVIGNIFENPELLKP